MKPITPIEEHNLRRILDSIDIKLNTMTPNERYPYRMISDLVKCLSGKCNIPEDLQLRTVAIGSYMISYINNPTEEAKLTHKALWRL